MADVMAIFIFMTDVIAIVWIWQIYFVTVYCNYVMADVIAMWQMLSPLL